MREIKFRVWDNRSKHFSPVPHMMNVHTGQISDLPSRYIIEQFTGLHDKDGKEIYDGDIIGGSIGLHIHWCDKSNGWQFTDGIDCYCYSCSGDCQPCDYDSCDYEVIGNIHENPELVN